MDYNNTPSFYNNEDYFYKYLGCTSYYLGLQRITKKIIDLTDSSNVLELGCALGITSIYLAREFPNKYFWGTDIREDVIEKACQKSEDMDNISFETYDMCNQVKHSLSKYDMIFLLYSFHHILDPLENKIEFLKDCYNNMKKGSYLMIAETFLPESVKQLKEDDDINLLFKFRSLEGYASTFWSALQSISQEGVEFALKVAKTSRSEEAEAGNHVFERNEEYLVKFSWLIDCVKKVGFEVIIAEPINCINENVILIRR